MRTIIAGGRNIHNYQLVITAVEKSGINLSQIISGGATGVDSLAIQYAQLNNIPVTVFKADWGQYGKKAGPIRNMEMAKHADALIAIWDGVSRGTKHMIDTAKRKGLMVYIHFLEE